jgi:hypothetical protein
MNAASRYRKALHWLKSPLYIGICLVGFVFEFFIELPFRIAIYLDRLL